jgi:hypothetical protein
MALSAVTCIAFAAVPTALSSFLGIPSIGTAVSSIVLVAAIVADLADEARARQVHGALVAVRPLSRLTELEPALSALAAAKIPVFPRAGRLRVLHGFFSPYAPVTLLVPAPLAEEARKIVER